MEVSVLIEPIENDGYRATSLAPTLLVAEGPTREEALERLRKLVRQRFANAELVQVQVELPGEAHPWKIMAGAWKDHADAAEFEQNMKQYRQQVDSDPERP